MQPTPDNQDRDALILLISDHEKLCLDAYLFNASNKLQAYKSAKGITTGDDATLSHRAGQWLSNRANKAYIDKYKESILRGAETQNSEQDSTGQRSLEAIISDFEHLISTTNDIKLKKDMLKELFVMKGGKSAQLDEDETPIRYYLPQRCDTCDYKAEYQAHNKQNE